MKDKIKEWIKIIVTAIVIAVTVSIFVQPVLVDGSSMFPTLKDKDYLIVNKFMYKLDEPEREDIIVAKSKLLDENNKNKKIVKRIIGLPNDHVVIKDGYVYVNDKKLDEEYLDNFYTMGNIDIIVPNDEIFVLGDNRSNSRDSRDSSIGTIEISDIIGKVAIRILPINKVTVFD